MKIVYKNGTDEIVEKKSRFIAHVYNVDSEEKAADIINGIKKKYWDARHNCYAYIIGDNNEIQKFSDDGEPQGTAGKPIMDIIAASQVHNCLIVVTRYFGGTLLGTGGLIRAYQEASKKGLDKSEIIDAIEGVSAYIDTDYNNMGKIRYICEEVQMLSTSGSNRISVDIEDVPLQLQHAFVAIEDERFYEHNGIDIKGIARAAYITLSNGDLSQGASTLTQQLLKNNVFNAYNETTIEKIKRKVQEQYLAVKLETYMNKQEILEDYLNTINLGNGYYGIQAASNGYFGKDVSELTLSECAVIASITQNPTKLNPVKNPDYNQERQQKVLRNMLSQGYIDEDEYEEALADDVYARVESLDIATSSTSTYSYYVDTLIDELIEDLKTQKGYTESQATNLIYKGGLQIYSTQDSNMQSIADSVVNNPSYYPSSTEFSISYALSVKDSSGKVSYYTHKPSAASLPDCEHTVCSTIPSGIGNEPVGWSALICFIISCHMVLWSIDDGSTLELSS
jgi:uncharacterized YigZ family protein